MLHVSRDAVCDLDHDGSKRVFAQHSNVLLMHHPMFIYKTFGTSEDIIRTKSEDVDTVITI